MGARRQAVEAFRLIGVGEHEHGLHQEGGPDQQVIYALQAVQQVTICFFYLFCSYVVPTDRVVALIRGFVFSMNRSVVVVPERI